RELAELPARIESLESRQQVLQQQVSDPAFYREPPARVAEVMAELAALDEEVTTAYARWEVLETVSGG
ncbi:MAG: ABC transporter ATP-binding protein, partial [Pseudomonadales bacterium]